MTGVLAVLAFNAGCAGKSIDESNPAALMKEAEDDISNDHYQIAIDKLRTIKNRFPYSKEAVDAQLKIGDVYFLQESFAEAAVSYETFRDLHPKHEKTAYAMFRIGKSHFNDLPSTVARDLTAAQKAVEAYNDYLRRFPASSESDEARKDLNHLLNTLAEKELYVGDFYRKRGYPESAKGRYAKVIELYPSTETAKLAKAKLEEIQANGR